MTRRHTPEKMTKPRASRRQDRHKRKKKTTMIMVVMMMMNQKTLSLGGMDARDNCFLMASSATTGITTPNRPVLLTGRQ